MPSLLAQHTDRPTLRVESRHQQHPQLRVWIAGVLDTVIMLYATALIVLLLTGGMAFGWLSLTRAAKPILVLLILVPIRTAFHQPSWLTALAERLWDTLNPSAKSLANRIPAAVRDVLFAFVVTTSATFAVGFVVNVLFPPARFRPFAMPFRRVKFAETFAAWDSGWYFDIAMRGYYFSADGQSSVAFFPLYPLAMRAVALPFGSSEKAVWAAGIAISCAAFLGGLLALHRLTERLFNDREVARRTVLYVAVFPFSFFLSRVYPSALFFLLTVLAVSAAYDSRWWRAGLWGALATLTRPHGILIGIPLGLMALSGAGARQIVSRFAALAPIPAGLLAYSLYVNALAGDPLAWLRSQSQWGFSLGHAPWQQLENLIGQLEQNGLYDYFFTSEFAPFRLFHGAVALFLFMVIPAVFRRLGAPLGAYVLVNLLVPLTGNALEGIGRYAAVVFPVFMVLGTLRWPGFHEALLIVWSLFLALFVGLFVTWYPIY